MSFFLQTLLEGISTGILYAISGLGFLMIYRSSRALNMAHGGFMTFGALLFLICSLWGNWPFIVSFPVALVGSLVLGILVERFLMRPLKSKTMIQGILMTLGLALILRGAINTIIDTSTLSFPDFLSKSIDLKWTNVQISSLHIGAFLLGSAFLALFWFFLRHTPQGICLRSVAQNPLTARSVGIRLKWIFSFSWAVAALACAVSGILIGIANGILPNTLGATGLAVFPVVVLGGLGSFLGAALGGILIGLIQCLTTAYMGAPLGEISPFIVLFLFLILKPSGLVGSIDFEKV